MKLSLKIGNDDIVAMKHVYSELSKQEWNLITTWDDIIHHEAALLTPGITAEVSKATQEKIDALYDLAGWTQSTIIFLGKQRDVLRGRTTYGQGSQVRVVKDVDGSPKKVPLDGTIVGSKRFTSPLIRDTLYIRPVGAPPDSDPICIPFGPGVEFGSRTGDNVGIVEWTQSTDSANWKWTAAIQGWDYFLKYRTWTVADE